MVGNSVAYLPQQLHRQLSLKQKGDLPELFQAQDSIEIAPASSCSTGFKQILTTNQLGNQETYMINTSLPPPL